MKIINRNFHLPHIAFLTNQNIWVMVLLIAFILLNSQTLSWGLPGRWNPDEISGEVNLALDGLTEFNQTDFTYPSLPKYFMLGIGRFTDWLGQPRATFTMVARFFSVVLGGMAVLLAYAMAGKAGLGWAGRMIAALLVFSNHQLALNSHFAHNDLYSTFFVGMVVLFAISYYQEKNRGWLYAAFFTSGLAASSKYIAGIIVLTALSAMIMVGGRRLIKSRLLTFEMLFTGSGLSILGYVIGTPTAILWLAFYLKRLIPALLRQTQYARTPTSVIGLKGEWNQLEQALGTHIFWLLILSVMFFIIIVMMRKKTQRFATTADHGVLTLLGISLLALDLPIIISYNVQVRYFLPMIPIFAVLIAAAVDAILVPLHQKQNKSVSILLISVLIAFISYSYLISIGVVLAIKNDSRIPAGAFLSRLPKGRTLEYTLYSPNFHEENFSRIHDYPLRFRKFPDEQLPEDSRFVYNEGESGIEERKTDYLVISSFIYNRFNDPYTCGIHAEDCAFFEKLLNGQSNYRNIANFSYQLPWYIPKTRLVFVNPEIRVYERVPLR